VGDMILIGETKYPVLGRLDPKSTFFRNSTLSYLDDNILVLMPYQTFYTLYMESDTSRDAFKNMTIQSHLCLLDVSEDDILKITKIMNASRDIKVIPIDFNDYITDQYKNQLSNIQFYILIVLGATMFVAIGIINNLWLLIDRNIKAYAVHLVYGSTMNVVYLRIFYYVLAILLPSLLIGIRFMIMTELIASISFLWQLLIITSVTGLLTVIPIYKLKKQNMLYYLRRDV